MNEPQMSAFDRAVFSVLRKLIPPEIMGLFSPERMAEIAAKAEHFVTNTQGELAAFKQEQQAQRAMLERLLNHAGIPVPLNAHDEREPPRLEQLGNAADHGNGGNPASGALAE